MRKRPSPHKEPRPEGDGVGDASHLEWYEDADALLEVLHRLKRGALIPFRRVFVRAMASGQLSLSAIDSLREGAAPGVAGYLSSVPKEKLKVPTLDVGETWVALSIPDAPGGAGAPLVLPRRLRCRVGRADRVAVGGIEPWSTGLATVIGAVSEQVASGIRRAETAWAEGSVRYSLHNTSGSEENILAVSDLDHSYDLAAACSLVSEAFGVPLPGGAVAMAFVDKKGRVEPFPDDLMAEKLAGLTRSMPSLDVLLVASEQVEFVRSRAPAGTTVTGLSDISELGLILGIQPGDFRGRRKIGRLGIAVSNLLNLPDSPMVDMREISRQHAATSLGGLLALVAAIGLLTYFPMVTATGGQLVGVALTLCFASVLAHFIATLMLVKGGMSNRPFHIEEKPSPRWIFRWTITLRFFLWSLSWYLVAYVPEDEFLSYAIIGWLMLAMVLPGLGLRALTSSSIAEKGFVTTLACLLVSTLCYGRPTTLAFTLLTLLLHCPWFAAASWLTVQSLFRNSRLVFISAWFAGCVLMAIAFLDAAAPGPLAFRESLRLAPRASDKWVGIVVMLGAGLFCTPAARFLSRSQPVRRLPAGD